MKTKTFWPMAALAILAVSGGCSGSGPGGGDILVTVQGEAIKMDDLNNYLAVKPTARVIVQGQTVELPVADTLAFQAMQDLVSRVALFQMAKDEGVSPTEKDVEDEIAFQKKLDPNFLTVYQRRGLTMGQIREEVRFSLVQEKLITKGITVTPAEADDWLAKNPDATVMPESVDLSWILAKTPDVKAKVDAELKNGTKFSEVAVKLSQAPNAAITNGRYLPERGSIPVNKLTEKTPPLREAVTKANVDTDTEWLQFSEGWAKFHVDAKNPPKKIEITPERKLNIQRNIALQRGNKASDLRKKLVDRIKNSEIVVRRDSLKEAWKNFAEMLRKQADQSSQGSGAPGGQPNTTGAGDSTPKSTGN